MNIQKTRCPHCSSIFTVSDTQLSIRDGYTRCGKCFKVFKADDYLLVEHQPVKPTTPTLFDDVGHALPAVTATKGNTADPTHIADLNRLEASKPAVQPAPIPQPAPSVNADNQLANTLSDQPLATLARMLANELSLLSPQPLLPIAAPPAAEPPAMESKPETLEPEISAEHDIQIPAVTASGEELAPEPVGTTPPVMSHIFEQEFNDLWLSSTDQSKPLATDSTTAEESVQVDNAPPAAPLDDGLTEHFNGPDSDVTALATTTEQVELSDAMKQMPSIVAHRSAEEEPADEEDLFSYLNKNNVAAAPAAQRAKRVTPGMQEAKDPKSYNKTTSRPSTPSTRQPSNKRTALPQLKRPNEVMERLTKPIPFFNINIPRTLGWGLLSLLMLGLLGIQYIYFNFDRIAAMPAYSPVLKQVCLYAGCEVPLVDVRKIKITNKVARHYPADPSAATRFTATMINHADSSQPYPSVQLLILKNGKIQSGRILKPAEYILSGYTALTKIPANTPVQIQFVLKIPRDKISVCALDAI